jgi:hypothetical protein
MKNGNNWAWKEFFRRELLPYNPEWSENEELLDALCDIMEGRQWPLE